MEDEVMEQIRTRLAAATSAAAALAKSLEALDENTLQTLELWLAKQEGDLRCGNCRAQMPRGKSSSVCIACGSKRPPLPNTLQFDFRVSFAFLQFLETIHPPLKAGGSNLGTVHSLSKQLKLAAVASLDNGKDADDDGEFQDSLVENAVEINHERAEDISKLDGAPHLDQSSTVFEDMAETDDISHLDQSSTGFEVMAKPDDVPHLDQSSTGFDDMAKLGGAPHLDQASNGFEDVAKLDDAVHLDQSSTNFEDMTTLDGTLHSNRSSTNLEPTEREPELAFKSATSTEAVSSWDTEWDYPTPHSLSAKNQLEESAQPETILKNSKEVTFAKPPEYDLSFFDSFGEMGSKDGNVTTETDADATFWDFQDTNLVNSRLARISAMERFGSDTSAFTTITDAESDSGDSSLDVLPPPTPPLDSFGEIGTSNGQIDLVGSLKSPELGNVTCLESGFQPHAHETTEGDFEEDWDDAEFVGSEFQPANEALVLTSHVDLLPFPSGSSPALGTSFASSFISGGVSMDKDKFRFDQSSPIQTSSNLLGSTPDNFTDFGTGLETLITMEGQKSSAGSEDPLKSVHGRSSSFGDFEKRPSDFEDLFKRSVSHGNLQGKDMAEGDELLKALQAPSIPMPARRSSEPGEDILNFLNLRPAPSQVNIPQPQGGVSSTNPSHGRSSSFNTVELVPDEQSDEMFQFFHSRSHSAGSSATKTSAVEDSSRGKDILNQISGSTGKAPLAENPVVNDDPFSFIHAAIAPSSQPEAAAVNGDMDFDDDDSFEWKSAPTPAETSAQTLFQPEAVSASASRQQDLFQWTSSSKPSSSPGKLSVGSGSLSGLLSLAGGLPPSQIRTSSSKEDDLFAALSRNSGNTPGAQNRQAGTRPQYSTSEVLNGSNPGDDSEDEFSDFVSTGAMPESAPSPASAQPPAAGPANQPPAFDASFFEAAQPIPSEKRNLDFFGDLMGLNFTNA